MLEASDIRLLFDYRPETGELLWRETVAGWRRSGAVAGSDKGGGYYRVRIARRAYLVHRLVWAWVTGEWPIAQIDHVDGNPSNNRFDNLRAASPTQNKGNSRRYRNNKVGLKGVCRTEAGRFRAQLFEHKRRHHLGTFDTPEAAHAAYVAAATRFFGEFARAS